MSSDERPLLLMVEDDEGLRAQLRWSFDDYRVVLAEDRESALAVVRRCEPAVMALDLGLPPCPDSPEEGFRLLRETLAIAPATKVIALTGQNDHDNAVRAIGLGAHDFFAKPFEADVLALVVARAFRVADLERENRRLRDAQLGETVGGLITRDPGMVRVCRQVERLAPTQASVLLLGESGTGKELLARALHEGSARRERRFVAINCAAIPEQLLESELFGYERGAFTGAARTTRGWIETADGGTLFLDEIGDLSLPLQAKLLRFLQERFVERVGGRTAIPVDVRVVCATHRNLRERIAQGAFREDLFYRLAELTVEIPPLRERAGDASLLAHAFVQRLAKAHGRERLMLGDAALDAIGRHPWPGNVRELENAIKRAVIMADGTAISAHDLGLPSPETDDGDGDCEGDGTPALPTLRQARDEAERCAVLQAMGRCGDNVARAADLLGVSRPTLYDLLHRFGLRRATREDPR